jgi:hypothetical protein
LTFPNNDDTGEYPINVPDASTDQSSNQSDANVVGVIDRDEHATFSIDDAVHAVPTTTTSMQSVSGNSLQVNRPDSGTPNNIAADYEATYNPKDFDYLDPDPEPLNDSVPASVSGNLLQVNRPDSVTSSNLAAGDEATYNHEDFDVFGPDTEPLNEALRTAYALQVNRPDSTITSSDTVVDDEVAAISNYVYEQFPDGRFCHLHQVNIFLLFNILIC